MNTTFAQTLALALTLSDDEKALLVQTLATLGNTSHVSAPTLAQAPAPKQRKALEPATDVTIPLTPVKGAGRGKKAFKLGYGNGRAGAKLCIKDAGFAWNTELGAYVGTNAQYDTLDITDNTLTVSATYVQAGRDKAVAKAERKANKNA